MTRIMFVISGLSAGGAERVMSLLSAHWLMRHEVSVVSFDCRDDEPYHTLPAGLVFHSLGAARPSPGRASKLANLLSLRRTIRREKPDVVISFLTKNNLLALIAAVGTDTPVICCERNNPERQQAHWFWNAALRTAYRRAALIVCQTRGVTRCMPSSVRERIRVIPNPVSAWPVKRIEAGQKTMAAVGRLTHQKGFDVLLEAFALAAPRLDDWRLVIWGEGSERPALEAQARRLGLIGKVLFNGTSRQPGEWVQSADIFVLSSRYEGFPNVVGEAMAAGVPVISTRCDFGPDEMIRDGEDGILVPPEDPAALAEALIRLVGDGKLRERLGKAGAASIKRFALDQVLPAWDRALDEALNRRRTDKPARAGSHVRRVESAR